METRAAEKQNTGTNDEQLTARRTDGTGEETLGYGNGKRRWRICIGVAGVVADVVRAGLGIGVSVSDALAAQPYPARNGDSV